MATEAGKRLWELLDRVQPGANGDVLRMGSIRSAIAAIEAEAVATERARIAEAVRERRISLTDPDRLTRYVHGFNDALAAVLAIIEGKTQHRHTIPKGANATASATDPDLTPLTTRVTTLEASMANALLRLAAVEAHFTPPTPPPALTRPWAAPVTTATYSVPGTVTHDGSADASAALLAFIATVPNGSVIDFPLGAAATYRLDTAILFDNRNNLVFQGNGASLHMTGNGVYVDSSGFYAHFGNSHISVFNFNFIGSNPTPGYEGPGPEGSTDLAQAVYITEGSYFEIAGCTGSALWGDLVRVTGGGTYVWVHDNHPTDAGNNLFSVVWASHVLVENNSISATGGGFFDIEPETPSSVSTDIVFRNNTGGVINYHLPPYFASMNGIAGSTVSNVTVTGNHMTGAPLRTIVSVARRHNIVITNNTSDVSAAGPLMDLEHIDGLTITGNTQPLSSGSLASITDCTSVVGP